MRRRYCQLVSLFRKKWFQDGQGGRQMTWDLLGHMWADICPVARSYPLVHQDQTRTVGMVYDLILRVHDDVFVAEKAVWSDQDYFPLSSPEQWKQRWVRWRMYRWVSDQDMGGCGFGQRAMADAVHPDPFVAEGKIADLMECSRQDPNPEAPIAKDAKSDAQADPGDEDPNFAAKPDPNGDAE